MGMFSPLASTIRATRITSIHFVLWNEKDSAMQFSIVWNAFDAVRSSVTSLQVFDCDREGAEETKNPRSDFGLHA